MSCILKLIFLLNLKILIFLYDTYLVEIVKILCLYILCQVMGLLF